MQVRKYLTNKSMQELTPFIINTNGEGYYILGETRIEKKEFENMYPIHSIHQKPNYDRSKLWMSDVQSY